MIFRFFQQNGQNRLEKMVMAIVWFIVVFAVAITLAIAIAEALAQPAGFGRLVILVAGVALVGSIDLALPTVLKRIKNRR